MLSGYEISPILKVTEHTYHMPASICVHDGFFMHRGVLACDRFPFKLNL